jgi:hypothetical protein
MKIENFSNLSLDESYLKSNFAPLYHFTYDWVLESILEDNTLKTGWVENDFFDKKIKIVSFTRERNLDLSHYKNDLNIIIELDKNKMTLNAYKFYPYDFFIQTKKEKFTKSDLRRKQPFEFEEASIKDIVNIDKYLLSVTFLNDSIFNSYKSVNILKSKKIPIYENNTRVF